MKSTELTELATELEQANLEATHAFGPLLAKACKLLRVQNMDLAVECGVSAAGVSRWRTSNTVPNLELRKQAYGFLIARARAAVQSRISAVVLTADLSQRDEEDLLPLSAVVDYDSKTMGHMVTLDDDDLSVRARLVRRDGQQMFLLDWETVKFKPWTKSVA